MGVLLDTHAALWWLLADSKLSAAAGSAIESSSVVYVSPASFWEIAIKIRLGTYTLNIPFEEFWEEAVRAGGVTILPIKFSHAAKVMELPLHHRDPFDRMLIAQSLVEQVALVSCETLFDAYSVQRIW